MTKRWSSTRSDLTKTKRQAAKEARRDGKELADQWMEIYRAEFHQLRAEGHTEDQATALAGKHAYEECDRLANEQKP